MGTGSSTVMMRVFIGETREVKEGDGRVGVTKKGKIKENDFTLLHKCD